MIEQARTAHPEVSVRRLCGLHQVSRSWFLRRPHQQQSAEYDEGLAEDIEAIVLKFSGYGYRRVTHELVRRDCPANHKRVMRERRLLCRPKRRNQTPTDSAHCATRFPNLFPQVVPTQPDLVWQADLTYIRVEHGFVYLACVLDSFTRKIVGWSLSKFMDADLPLAALNNALAARRPAPGLHHSDQRAGPVEAQAEHAVLPKTRGAIRQSGVQRAITNRRYHAKYVQEGKPLRSAKRRGLPYNARIESFYKILKTEEVDLQDYLDLEDAQQNLDRFIGECYDHQRLHSSLGYVPPAEFAARYHSA